MNITWVTRSFLDYRIPVYAAIDKLCGHKLSVIFYKDVVPERCQNKLSEILGNRAIGLSSEIRLGGKKKENQTFANKGGLRIPLRPGLYKILKNTNPDIVLSDGFFQWTYAALLLNALQRTPHLMLYERTSHTERDVSYIRKAARKAASRFISGIACNGKQSKSYLEKFGFPKDKIFLGNMAADTVGLQKSLSQVNKTEIKTLKRKYNINGLVFLYVGQLIERKGIMEMLESWKTFSASKPNLNLILVGDGDQKEQVESFVKTGQLKSVKVLGKVDYSEVAVFYALSDVFIISTLEDNWSLVVPEAMSCGLPILSSIYNGCWPELVRPENGWIFDPLDQTNFIEVLENAYENRNQWKAMGKASKKIVENYTPEKIADQIFKTCKALTT
jgi:glycosyltransferase involved in cell wall biosynthesis